MTIPDRITTLIRQVEAGRPVTKQDVARLAQLQALDLAKLGEDFARDVIAREEAHTENQKRLEEARYAPASG